MTARSTTDLDVQIGARVRARREALGINQSELGRRIGVTFQQVQKYEKGVNRISASTLIRAAEALLCPASDLLGVDPGLPSASDADLLRAWRALTEMQQQSLLRLMQAMSEP